jgi:Uma2 family endonuclease
MSLTWPNRQLTLEEWEALPAAEGVRMELVEGLVVMAPMPLSWHQKAGMRIGYWLDEQLPADLTALTEVDVVLVMEPATVRIPGVMVTRTSLYETNPSRYTATDVLLVVEILSDGTRRVDRMVKFAEYAEAGIPQYWIVDPRKPSVEVYDRDADGNYQLTARADGDASVTVAGNYELSGEHTGQVELSVAGHPVSVDLDGLTRR